MLSPTPTISGISIIDADGRTSRWPRPACRSAASTVLSIVPEGNS
ncbi:hypothetical protein ACWEQC_08505 [Streptomyces shenzhenensis]